METRMKRFNLIMHLNKLSVTAIMIEGLTKATFAVEKDIRH